MSPRRHLDDLFSAAYEDELSPIDEARFQTHMQSCAPCAEAYAEFRATVEALRELPRARMPHVVHLPSTPPVAERAVTSADRAELVQPRPAPPLPGDGARRRRRRGRARHRRPRARPGGSPTNSAQSRRRRPDAAGVAASGVRSPSRRASQIVDQVTGASPPVELQPRRISRPTPAQPALASRARRTDRSWSAPGRPAVVYAQLSRAGGSRSPIRDRKPRRHRPVRCCPCVSVAVGNARNQLAALPAGADRMEAASLDAETSWRPRLPDNGAAGPFLAFHGPGRPRPGNRAPCRRDDPGRLHGPGEPAADGAADAHDALTSAVARSGGAPP